MGLFPLWFGFLAVAMIFALLRLSYLAGQKAEGGVLDALVGRTADGVLALPGMDLWDCNGDKYTIEWISLRNLTDGAARTYDRRWNHNLELNKLYSTLKAAQKARERFLEEQNDDTSQ